MLDPGDLRAEPLRPGKRPRPPQAIQLAACSLEAPHRLHGREQPLLAAVIVGGVTIRRSAYELVPLDQRPQSPGYLPPLGPPTPAPFVPVIERDVPGGDAALEL